MPKALFRTIARALLIRHRRRVNQKHANGAEAREEREDGVCISSDATRDATVKNHESDSTKL